MPGPIYSYWQLVEPVFTQIDLTDEATFFGSTAEVPRPIVLLYAAHFCLSEVHNGGFLQFYWNSTGLVAPEAIEGFKVLGMPKLAAFLEMTAAPLGSPYPRDRDIRWDALLEASGREEQELEKIFEEAPNLYLAFLEATEGLSWDVFNQQAWELAETENGGFQEAATGYAINLQSESPQQE